MKKLRKKLATIRIKKHVKFITTEQIMKSNETDIERAYGSIFQSPPAEEPNTEVVPVDNRSLLARLWDNHPYLVLVVLSLLGVNALYNVFKYQHNPEFASVDPFTMVIVYILGLVTSLGIYVGAPLLIRKLSGQLSKGATWGIVIVLYFVVFAILVAGSDRSNPHLSLLDIMCLTMAFRILRLA